jgi:hypothetical protein
VFCSRTLLGNSSSNATDIQVHMLLQNKPFTCGCIVYPDGMISSFISDTMEVFRPPSHEP